MIMNRTYLLRERFATKIAWKPGIFVMSPEMSEHICFLGKRLATMATRERFLASVHRSNVGFKIATLCKTAITIRACMIFCSSVDFDMYISVTFLGKSFSTCFTVIGSFRGT